MKVCETCQKEYPDDVKFCKTCGTPLMEKQEASFCPYCGATLDADSRFCPSCGKAVEGEEAAGTGASPAATAVPAQGDAPSALAPVEEVPPVALDERFQLSSGGIVLHSGAPLPSKTGWCKWAYIAGLLLLLAGGFGLIVLLFTYAIEYYIIQFQKDKLRRMKFKFVSPVTTDDIYSRLQPVLMKKYGNAMQFDREDDTIVVRYDEVIYDINPNEDGTVSIWWRKSLAGAFLRFREGKLYRKIRTGTALIAYELQQQFGVHE